MEQIVNLNEEEKKENTDTATQENKKEKKTLGQRFKALGKAGKTVVIGSGTCLVVGLCVIAKVLLGALSRSDDEETMTEDTCDDEVSEE